MTKPTAEDLRSVERLIMGMPRERIVDLLNIPEISSHLDEWSPSAGPQEDAYYSKADCLLFGGEPGGGKDLSIRTVIPTPYGSITMGEISIGDEVFDERGVSCSVLAKSSVFNHECFRITFSDGSEIITGAGHQWVTTTRRERAYALKSTPEYRAKRREARPSRGSGKKPWLAVRNAERAESQNLPLNGVRTTQEIFDTLRVGTDNRANHAVDVCGSLELPEASLLIDPYVLGAWLGDGTSDSGPITTYDEEVLQRIAGGGYEVRSHSKAMRFGILGLQKHLRQLGVLGNKHIPPAYLRASANQRLGLLKGLMDTDGHCDKRGQCEISLTRRVLIDGVWELLSSLGIKAQLREGIAKLDGREIGPKWRLKFLSDLAVFTLPRKLLRQKRGGFRGTHNVRFIVDVQPTDSVPTQCIQVDSPSRMYLCGRSMIPTHNSQLLLGLAYNEHQRSFIMRREYGDLERLIEDCLKIHGSRDGFNGSPPPRLRFQGDKAIYFRAAHRIGDEKNTMGQGRDLLGIDEATQFAESQIRFLMGWVRTENPNQRCRTVLATNPPLTADGLWVTKMFAPWLDETYGEPAEPGELRWVITDEEGLDLWVDGPEDSRLIGGKMMDPTSRSYIPSKVTDNPYYVNTEYHKRLDAMTEPWRSLLMGGFRTQFKDQDDQLIPTIWIKLAMDRWHEDGWKDCEMTAMSLDPSGGGEDDAIISARHGGWFARFTKLPPEMTKDGSSMAAAIVVQRRGNCPVVVDMGGGYGGDVSSRLKENGIDYVAYNGAGASASRTRDGMKFKNKRAEDHWKLREELNPDREGGSIIALPPDPDLLAELAAPTFTVTTGGIKIQPKEDIKKKIGRSPNKSDAIVMNLAPGNKAVKRALGRRSSTKKVILGYAKSKQRTGNRATSEHGNRR